MIGELISLYRRVNNMTTRELAEQMGTSPATISRLESGKDCDLGTMLKVINWLFTTKVKEQTELKIP